VISKLNTLPAGVALGAILTGMPLWLYAEKKIEERTTMANAIADTGSDIAGLLDSDRILHQRITETDKDAEKERKELAGRLRSVEAELKAAQIDIARISR
jgi:hypothetical protein